MYTTKYKPFYISTIHKNKIKIHYILNVGSSLGMQEILSILLVSGAVLDSSLYEAMTAGWNI